MTAPLAVKRFLKSYLNGLGFLVSSPGFTWNLWNGPPFKPKNILYPCVDLSEHKQL